VGDGTSHRGLDRLGFRFREAMAGHVGVGEADPSAGAALGRRRGTPLRFDVEIRIASLGEFLRVAEHEAELSGTVTFAPLGGTLPIRDGRFNLFAVEGASGTRRMTYAFRFSAQDGRTFFLRGHKDVRDDAGLDVVADMTTLFTAVHAGEGEQAPVYAAGELRFDLREAPALLASMDVEGARSLAQKVAAYAAFTSFAWGALRDEYLRDERLLYDTRYENIVVSGRARRADGTAVPFFLVSGVHDRGFPWGDGELFSDLLLAVGDGRGGWRRFAITDRTLEGLFLDVAGGAYRYRGPLFAIGDGFAASFTQMRAGAPHLARCDAELELAFEARPHDAVNVVFPLVPGLVRRLSSRLAKELRDQLPGTNPMGIFITPHGVTPRSGTLRVLGERGVGELAVLADLGFGEAERGTFRNVKDPKTLYGYLCAVRPGSRAARVQIHSRTLRDARERWGRDRLTAFLGSVVSRAASSEMRLEGGKLTVHPLAPAGAPAERAPLLRKLGDPVVEVNNDHFPTAVFQRRIVEVLDPGGERCLALEEDMSLLRLEAVHSDRKVTVASIRGDDPLRALDRVLDETGFDALLEARWATSASSRRDFAIAVKPNFMFAYDKRDRSTYTDPALVHHLVRRLRARGFERIQVVEAQSTYGEYFDRRSVREVADYLGYDGSAGYEVVDMTLDADERRHLGPHLGEHPVSRAWREAGFRISFAKNKTHAYAFYTLTLKNIYGALPLANKFKEYHCRRGIYETTLEYLAAFPVDYGLVDAWLSADGPFGIFADPAPNETRTVLGGADLVAVDWVGASKMGIDPMISPYLRLAVEASGKPEIRLVGDSSPYRPWLNVPVALTLFTNKGVDADHFFGNLMYAAAAQMDETHFQHKNRSWWMRGLRQLTNPVRRAFFVRTGENPSAANRFFGWLFYRMGI
jgi:cholesterol oxidase